jgi:ribosome-binding ATPase YchF (GTP1/OBG family)
MAGWGLIRAKHKPATKAIKNLLVAPGRPATAAPADVMRSGIKPAAREKGLYRMEGKEYVVKDGDVLLSKFNA